MEYKYLYQVLPFLDEIDEDRRRQFIEYFDSAPVWLMESFQIEEMDKGVIFVRENTPVDTIYLIGKGTIKATDYRFYGIAFDFMHFDRVYAMGGMEIIMDLDVYRTTLQTATPCTVVKIPKAKFERWIKTDIKALKREAKYVGEYLLEQGRDSRAYLFLQGADRLAMLLSEHYERSAKSGILRLENTRQEYSDMTGLCVKTINRSIKKFEQEGLICKKGTELTINKEQYEQLKQRVAEVIGQE